MKAILAVSALAFCSVLGWGQKTSQAHASAASRPATFTNPLLPTGPDPWVIVKDGVY